MERNRWPVNVGDLSRRLRVRLVDRGSRMALGPAAGQVPDRYVRSVIESMWRSDVAAHVESWARTTDAEVEHYDFPSGFPPQFRRSKAFDEQFVYRLRDVMVSPHLGLVWLPDGSTLGESYGSLSRSLTWGDVRTEMLRPVTTRVEGPVVAFPSIGYFHWLLEVLPAAIRALASVADVKLLLPRSTSRFAYEAACELVPQQSIVFCEENVRAESLILAGIDPYSGFVSRTVVADVRAAFPVEPANEGAIYISRSRDMKRRLGNEAEVEELMSQRGIAVVHLADLSFRRQRELVAGAEVVIGPHGAGLANAVWCRDARYLIEIFPSGVFNDCYARLSANLGIRYEWLTAVPDPRSAGQVPIDRLCQVLEAVGY